MTDTKSKKDFEDEQKQARESQNLSNENAVPEQRPQAFLQNEGPQKSELTQKLEDEGAIPKDDEPMDKSAYDRADSDSQKKKAGDDSKVEGVMVGNGVKSTKGPHEGRIFAVTRIVSHGNVADMVRTATGSPEQLYNAPSEVECRAIGDERDGETVVLSVEDDGLEKLNEGWRGTRAGRRH
jgi:hypothetical protein